MFKWKRAFDKISSDDIHGLSLSMLEAFKDTADFNGETLEELNKETYSVIEINLRYRIIQDLNLRYFRCVIFLDNVASDK